MNKNKVLRLREARETAALLADHLAERKKEFEEENHALIEHVAYARAWAEQLTDECKEERVAEWDGEDKSKEDYFGFGIQERKNLFYDEGAALEWAIKHGIALDLNKKKFESIADDGSLDFVLISFAVTATAPGDLDKWLE